MDFLDHTEGQGCDTNSLYVHHHDQPSNRLVQNDGIAGITTQGECFIPMGTKRQKARDEHKQQQKEHYFDKSSATVKYLVKQVLV